MYIFGISFSFSAGVFLWRGGNLWPACAAAGFVKDKVKDLAAEEEKPAEGAEEAEGAEGAAAGEGGTGAGEALESGCNYFQYFHCQKNAVLTEFACRNTF